MVDQPGTTGRPVSKVSMQDFLFPDRHRRLYADFFVYLPEDKILDFMALMREGRDAEQIRAALGLAYRGDVLFAMLLCHLAKRDGVLPLPGIDAAVPPELAAAMPALEEDWRQRNEKPAPYGRPQ